MKTALVIIFIIGVAASFFLKGQFFPERNIGKGLPILSSPQISSRLTIPELLRRLTQPQAEVVRSERGPAVLPSEGAVRVENVPAPILSLLPIPIFQRPVPPAKSGAERTPVSKSEVSLPALPATSSFGIPVSPAPLPTSSFSAFLLSLPPELGPVRPYVPSESQQPAFSLSPELVSMRTAMIASGTILSTEFSEIKNNDDIEAFLLKMIEWKGIQVGASSADIAASQGRIRAAYDRLKLK
ncbi:MAG: hypothetical protein HY221_00925 [Candidatus Sungbacteria bacterium]|uniref:Uncharacterized protein n=1 Tax=Candidatus Sungiibacteriota bacterium TaxID=2750080 RepID=A0A932VRN8_9BACT|nr:hypothetical protein [Candidatus Sungbacteria bacterium]